MAKGMRIKQARVHDSGQVTIQYEGDDPASDFGPVSPRLAQREAVCTILSNGTTPGFFVAAMNHRSQEDSASQEHAKAERFAVRNSLHYLDLVRP